eukprot:15453283-Alexandrium_andersonii.AAC.1
MDNIEQIEAGVRAVFASSIADSYEGLFHSFDGNVSNQVAAALCDRRWVTRAIVQDEGSNNVSLQGRHFATSPTEQTCRNSLWDIS